jgi:hypothetical protein
MAYWNGLKFRKRSYINTFGKGVNTYVTPFEVSDGEITDEINMCSDDLPAIRVRNDRVFYSSQLTTPNGIGKRNNSQLHVVDGNTWKYWSTATNNFVDLSTALSNTSAKILDYARGTNRYTIVWNSSQAKYWDGTSTALNFASTDLPYTKLFTVHKGRIYGLSDNDITYNALQLIDDWTSVNDAGSIDVTRSVGVGTAITTFADHVIVWSENSMHELFGTGPYNYELKDITNDVGCVNDRTVIEVKGSLFWLDYTGVYQYTGGLPRKVSDKVSKYINGINWTYKSLCASGVKDDKMYLSIPYGSTACNKVLVYDIRKDIWHIEDGNFINFVNISDTLYGQQADGFIQNMDNGLKTGLDNSTAITWQFETKAFNDNTIAGQKTLSEMYMVAEGTSNATKQVLFSTNVNSSTFVSLIASTGLSTEPNVIRTVLPSTSLQNTNWYRFRVKGTGQVKVHSIHKNFRIKER